jgi:transposase InsO family protein
LNDEANRLRKRQKSAIIRVDVKRFGHAINTDEVFGTHNPLWGAPRIHGEVLKLGFEIAESTVSKYMTRRRGPPSQTWRTFLRNHAHAIAAIDLCVVPTLTFECLFAFLVVGHGRRQLLWFAVTRHPTAEWLAQQIVEAFPWDETPTYLVRDNDGAYGRAFTDRVRTMGIRDRPISPRSPWQNPYVERLIGTLRRECLDHVLIFGERHLRRILTLYSLYYNETRTHLGLGKDAPLRHKVVRRRDRGECNTGCGLSLRARGVAAW